MLALTFDVWGRENEPSCEPRMRLGAPVHLHVAILGVPVDSTIRRGHLYVGGAHCVRR